jgi:hypothetical protein
MQLDRLGALFAEHDCYCVIIIELDSLWPATLGGYVQDCAAPDVTAALLRHVRRGVRDLPDEGLEARLAELAQRPETRRALGPAPRMPEVVALAGLLVRHGVGEITFDEVLLRCGELVERQVLEWFAVLRNPLRGPGLEPELRLGAFRIALAVFADAPYDVVAQAAEELAKELITVAAGSRVPRRPLFADDRGSRLSAMRAELVDGYTDFGDARIPTQTVRYQDDRFAPAILTYLWQWHHSIRPSLMRWLTKLCEDERVTVWLSAAQTLGVVCALDFVHVFHDLVLPWANASDPDRRMSAAVVLDQAAQDERVRPAVESIVRDWARGGTDEERWTAAAALGRYLGLRDVVQTLDVLRVVGTYDEGELAEQGELMLITSWSLASLFAAGALEPVLRHLAVWLVHRHRGLRHLALMSVLQLAATRSADVWNPEGVAAPAGQERWPFLLSLLDQHAELTEPFADLWWHALCQAPAQQIALDLMGDWIRCAERDGRCLERLLRFLPLLVDNEADWCRLSSLLNRMRNDWAAPLQPGVAGRIEHALGRQLDAPAGQTTKSTTWGRDERR